MGIQLTAAEFYLLWSDRQPGDIPVPLGVRHLGVTEADRAELVRAHSATLEARGLGTIRMPQREVVDFLDVIADATESVELHLSYFNGEGRGLVAARSDYAVFASHLAGHVYLSRVRTTALSTAAAQALPGLAAGRGRTANVRWDDYVRAGEAGVEDGEDAFLDVLREARVHEPEAQTILRALRDRQGGGQFGVWRRDRYGRRIWSQQVLTWLDAEHGRYLARRRGEWLTIAPADDRRIAAVLDELFDELRER